MWLDPLLPLAPVLDPVLDPLVVRLGHAAIGVLRGPPLRARHAAIRERALETMAERRSTVAAPLPSMRSSALPSLPAACCS
ncbi:MAG: hypothetical protein NVS3B10_29970 [Polyangiales bacterium]